MGNGLKSKKADKSDLTILASKKIYFGHQSVGYNIMDALASMVPAGSKLVIKETDTPGDFKQPLFAHSKNGENVKPLTKIQGFVEKMDSGLGNRVNIAFFKFCYVDVNACVDVNGLFFDYKKAMDGLIKKYPKTRFIHVTIPVTKEEEGLVAAMKSMIKSLIGRKTGFEIDNIKRMEFNNLLRKEYGPRVFDLALIESSDSDGREIISNKGGIAHQALLEEYTTDGGHLNQLGGEVVVSKLVKFLTGKNI